MPVIWQSSQQPMYVRTVWVNGLRHAVLTRDDPFYSKIKSRQKRPHTTTGYSRQHDSRLSYEREDLEQCLRKSNFIVKNTEQDSVFEDDIERLDLSEIDQQSEEDLILKPKTVQLNEYESSRSKLNNLTFDMRTVRSNRTARTDVKENTDLSDRVLQWLDLAGKVDLLAPEPEPSRLTQPRHSWPVIQNRNIQKTKMNDLKKTPKHEVREPIDRHDFQVPSASNTLENYARQSRDSAPKTKDNNKTKAREPLQETRNRIAIERHAVEKQYAELVNKKILPDYKAKKQVHIFMPPAPAPKTGSSITGITESLLSQLSKSAV